MPQMKRQRVLSPLECVRLGTRQFALSTNMRWALRTENALEGVWCQYSLSWGRWLLKGIPMIFWASSKEKM